MWRALCRAECPLVTDDSGTTYDVFVMRWVDFWREVLVAFEARAGVERMAIWHSSYPLHHGEGGTATEITLVFLRRLNSVSPLVCC
jgi:hypothetical protein